MVVLTKDVRVNKNSSKRSTVVRQSKHIDKTKKKKKVSTLLGTYQKINQPKVRTTYMFGDLIRKNLEYI